MKMEKGCDEWSMYCPLELAFTKAIRIVDENGVDESNLSRNVQLTRKCMCGWSEWVLK